MSTARLTFLYPHLFRGASRLGEPSAHQIGRTAPARRKPAHSPATATYHDGRPFMNTSGTRQASTFAAKRHGKAVEPLPLHAVPKTPPAASKQDKAKAAGAKTETKPTLDQTRDVKPEAAPAAPAAAESKSKEKETPTQAQVQPATEKDAAPPKDTTPTTGGPASASPTESKGSDSPMETILHMPPPSSTDPSSSAPSDASPNDKPPPHLTPPPYVHHFDSYSLVKHLEEGGWTRAQAITAMKAVRGLLAGNLSVAEAGLVSKSDVENETYLFRAACSELSTEVRNNRRVADEGLRQQRTLLQHEADILAQRLNQELQTLADDVRGMFNDRRMAVREEQKAAESAIQQINYKIMVELNSDARSEIEALRWVLIRRSVLGIIFMAVLTLGSLRYASYVTHERKKQEAENAAEEKRRAEAEKHREAPDNKNDHSPAPDAAEILAAN